MDDNKYTELLRIQSTQLTERTPFCPEDQEIAEYYDGGMEIADRSKMERHLVDCRFCLGRIGALSREQQSLVNKRIPEDVLATAKQFKQPLPVQRPARMTAWAAAAVVLIGLFTIVSRDTELVSPQQLSPTGSPSTQRQVRSVNRHSNSLNVLAPLPGSEVSRNSMLRWEEVPGNIHYNIFILSAAGDVLWTERLWGTHWVLDDSLQLAADNKYYFRVEAQLADGRSVSSRHVIFQVAEQP
jgi:hypothetical protein